MEIERTINDAIDQYYREKGKPTPRWKQKKDPEWWTEYLIRMGLDPRNK